MWVWFPVCPLEETVLQLAVWEHEACPLSGIKKVHLWEIVSVYLDSDFNPCHNSYSVLYREVVL